MDDIIELVKATLPSLQKNDLTALENRLKDIGVEGLDDMLELKEEDLVPSLKLLHARRLLRTIKTKLSPAQPIGDTPTTPTMATLPPTPTIPNRSMTPQRETTNASGNTGLQETPTSRQQNWSRNFKINWSSLPQSLQHAINNKQPVAPADRRKFVSRVCEDIAKITRLPGRRALTTIASQVVDKHPATFMDTALNGVDMLGTGYQSLLQAFENYMTNHFSRGNGGQKRPRSSSTTESENERPFKRQRLDKDGYLNWEPTDTEDEDSVEEKRNWLKQEILKRDDQADHDKIAEVLKVTFPAQRHLINSSQNLANVKQQWPALFHKRYLSIHFELLMGFPISRLDEELVSYAQGLLQLARKKLAAPTKTANQSEDENNRNLDLQDIVSNYDIEAKKGNSTWAVAESLLPLLVLLLGDEPGDVFKIYPQTTSLDEVDLDQQTPYVAIIGDNVWHASYHIVAEGTVGMSYMTSLTDSLKGLFMTYFCFNIPYAAGATATLEFIQRCLAKLNPDKGTKAPKKKGRGQRIGGGIHPKLFTLNQKLKTAVWQV